MSEKVKLSDYVKESVAFVQADFTSTDELFEAVYKQALKLDWVTENFIDKIKEREINFPTGMQLENYGAAIPHTDPECVKQEFVAVITNRKKIPFQRMDDAQQTVAVEIVFVLGLNQPHAQLEMLQSLMGLLQDEALLGELLAAPDVPQLLNVITKNNL